MNLVNKVILVLSVIATLIFWIGGIILIGDFRHILLDPQVVGWGGVYLNLFKFIALPLIIALASLNTGDHNDVVVSIKTYIGAIIVAFFATIPITLCWLLFGAILGLVVLIFSFVVAYGSAGVGFLIIVAIIIAYLIAAYILD